MQDQTIFLIRHGESTFNAAFHATGVDPLHFDAPLTPRGHEQVAATRLLMREHPVGLVLASPLTRALQTATGIFADHPSHPAIEVDARHRERLESSCDRGRAPADLRAEYPAIGFDHLLETWWHDEGSPDPRGIHIEPLDVMMDRLRDFAAALQGRTERTIAVVGHGTFFYHLIGRWLANCEVTTWDGTIAGPMA